MPDAPRKAIGSAKPATARGIQNRPLRPVQGAEIGKVKARDGMEITNPERESEVIKNICEKNNGPLDDDTLQVLFRQIIDACKSLE